MIKQIAYRFTLFVLLLSSLTQLFANLYYLTDAESAPSFIQNTEAVNFVWFSKEKQDDRLTVLLFENEEKEDDELLSFKKHSEIANYSASLLFTPTFGYFFSFVNKTSPFSRDLSYTSTCRYLSLQVFRI